MVYAQPRNRTRKWDAQTDHLISARRPDQVVTNKKRELAELWTLLSQLTTVWNWKKKNEKKIGTSNLPGNWKTVEHESDGDTNFNWYSWYSHQRIGTRTEVLGNKGMSEDHPNYSIIMIGQNTEENPGDLKKLAVTQTSVTNHRLALV